MKNTARENYCAYEFELFQSEILDKIILDSISATQKTCFECFRRLKSIYILRYYKIFKNV